MAYIALRKTLTSYLRAGILASTALHTGQAMAQDTTPPPTNGQIAEIVVTAQRRAENSQNVPIAITSLSATALSRGGVIDTGDLKQITPGLSFNTNLGGYGQPRIRGVGSTATGPGIENPVATYVDGVYIGSASNTIFGLSDVQQVDVLKGPQGTLFGRNATGGLIQVTTRDPTHDLHADFSGGYGNYDTWTGAGYVSGGLTNTLAASVAGSYSDQGRGWGTNLVTGQQVEKGWSDGVRAKLLWTPDADTRVTLSGDYSDLKRSDPAIRTVSKSLITGQYMGGGPYDIALDTQPYLHTTAGGGSLTVKHSFESVDLTSISAYRQSFLHTIIDADQTALPLLAVDITQKDTQLSQEVQLTSHTSGPLKWVLGAYYYWQKGRYDPGSTYGSFLGGRANDYDEALLNSYAAYGQATYALGDATNVTAGLRYTLDQRSLQINDTFNGFAGGAEYAKRSYPKLTWRLAVDHRLSRELMVYASYNRGFKSGSFQPDTNPVLALLPETLDAFEAGFKADLFDRKVRLNLSGFYYNYTNLQANQIVNGTLYVYDAPGSINYGLDADLIVKPVANLTFNAGVSWLHARYKNGFLTPFWSVPLATGGNAVTQCVPGVNYTGTIFAPCDASGHHLQDTPDFTGNVGVSYDIPTGSAGTFTLASNYYYNGGYYGDAQNRLHQNAYGLLDASLTWVAPGERFRVKGWGKNLTNRYYTLQYDALNFGDNIVTAPPRTYGVTVEVKY